MARVVCDFSLSLDGYVAGPGVSLDTPMGEGGEALHDWMFADDAAPEDLRAKRSMVERTGAVVLGRRTYDVGIAHWNGTPFPVPCFVVTHRPLPLQRTRDGSFAFVDQGIEAALRLAREAAGDREVRLMGAEVARQCLSAGLVDEVVLQLVPLLLGAGAKLFPEGPGAPPLRQVGCIPTRRVVHLRYDVARE